MLFAVFREHTKEQTMFTRHGWHQHQKHPMFTRILTGTPPPHGSVHGLLSLDKLKTLSIFANSLSATPISSPGIKGFTGLMSISYNKINGPHGFTGPAPYSPCWFNVRCSMFDVRCSYSSAFGFRPSAFSVLRLLRSVTDNVTDQR